MTETTMSKTTTATTLKDSINSFTTKNVSNTSTKTTISSSTTTLTTTKTASTTTTQISTSTTPTGLISNCPKRCLNGGSCILIQNNETCACNFGYFGPNCEYSPYRSHTSFCKSKTCLNGNFKLILF
jgi:hypothetical protein